jgi:integrase
VQREAPAHQDWLALAIVPSPDKLSAGAYPKAVKHQSALPYNDVPAFMASLRVEAGVAARALEFCILTASRTGEVLGARWAEIDIKAKIWTVPPERMKARREHRVPLSDRAMILDQMQELPRDEFVFSGVRKNAL